MRWVRGAWLNERGGGNRSHLGRGDEAIIEFAPVGESILGRALIETALHSRQEGLLYIRPDGSRKILEYFRSAV